MSHKNDNITNPNSYYDGDVLTNVFYTLVLSVLRVISLDLLTPIVICFRLKWRAEHTYLNGKRLIFTGQIKDLLKKNAVWVFLSVVTFGVFIPFKTVKMMQWEAEHTHFVGVPQENYSVRKSEFTCSCARYAGVCILKFLVTVLSFGFAYFWAYAFKERALTKHKFIDGHSLEFHATGNQFFLKKLLWTLLTVLTLGIYGLSLKGKMLRWQIANTDVTDPNGIPFSAEVAEKQPITPVNQPALISFFSTFPVLLFLLCAWLSRVLCVHGFGNAIITVPYVFVTFATVGACALFALSFKSYRNSLKIKSGKYLSVILCGADVLLAAIGLILLGYLIFLSV